MYKVFLDNKKIWITHSLKKPLKKKYKVFRQKDISIEAFLKKIEAYKSGKFLFLMEGKDPMKEFVKAFIKRRGKWDLPKGKLEKGEDIQECSLREVSEETGIKKLKLLGKRIITYHIYKQNEQWCLKETHWYNMYCDHKEDLCPQTEEDIELCAWKKPKKLKKLLKNSFSSLQEVFKGEY